MNRKEQIAGKAPYRRYLVSGVLIIILVSIFVATSSKESSSGQNSVKLENGIAKIGNTTLMDCPSGCIEMTPVILEYRNGTVRQPIHNLNSDRKQILKRCPEKLDITVKEASRKLENNSFCSDS